jgi:hypothetical protein
MESITYPRASFTQPPTLLEFTSSCMVGGFRLRLPRRALLPSETLLPAADKQQQESRNTKHKSRTIPEGLEITMWFSSLLLLPSSAAKRCEVKELISVS